MDQSVKPILKIDFKQLISLVEQLPQKELIELQLIIDKLKSVDEPLHLISEPVLAKDWLRPEEDELWKDL